MYWFLNRLDYLEVFDSHSVEQPQLGEKLSGNELPNSIESTGSRVFLQFHSDDWGGWKKEWEKGFEIHYHASK